MSIEKINNDLCVGCGICVNSCPTDVIRLDEKIGKAVIMYLDECTLCAVCEMDCPQHAIYVGPHKEGPLVTHW
jgi:NAD-dependent dihydropyrimidine dehydrogenase PreA subunit